MSELFLTFIFSIHLHTLDLLISLHGHKLADFVVINEDIPSNAHFACGIVDTGIATLHY